VQRVRRRRRRVAGIVVAAALALAACTGGDSGQTPTTSSPTTATVPVPSTSLTPEQQAAEDAKHALLFYEQTVDSINQAGGQDPKMRLPKIATGKQLTYLMKDAARLRQNGWRQIGSTSVKNIRVGSVELSGTPRITLSFCLDASNTDGVDSKGKSIRQAGAYEFFEEIVTLIKQRDKGWLVSQEDDRPVKSC
jgi:hypothetical protein